MFLFFKNNFYIKGFEKSGDTGDNYKIPFISPRAAPMPPNIRAGGITAYEDYLGLPVPPPHKGEAGEKEASTTLKAASTTL